MATNTTTLIVVAAMAALVLIGMLVVVVRNTRPGRRDNRGAAIAIEHALQLRRELRADESAARAEAAMVEIQTSLRHHDTSYRSEAVTSGDQLNEGRVHRLAG
jgi:hypothetical protein